MTAGKKIKIFALVGMQKNSPTNLIKSVEKVF
jgi:hypothetical protein